MPKYVYQCQSCPGYFEIHHGMTEEETNCPQCGLEDRALLKEAKKAAQGNYYDD